MSDITSHKYVYMDPDKTHIRCNNEDGSWNYVEVDNAELASWLMVEGNEIADFPYRAGLQIQEETN